MGKDDNIKWIDIGEKNGQANVREETKRIWKF